MKRFFGLFFIAVFMLSASVFSLTSCKGFFETIGGITDSGDTNGQTHNHAWNTWETKEAATCISTGILQRSCKMCDETESKTLEITDNHDFHSGVCALCGYISDLDDYFEFAVLENGTYSVTAKQYTPRSIVIPSEYKGIRVTVIGERAFSRCNLIESVEIPDSIVRIEAYAFMDCTYLTKIDIPESVTQIEVGAFENCTASLRAVSVKSGNPSYHSDNNCLIETASNTLILGCESSIIPSYVTKIGDSAFRGCSGLAEISLPERITEIGSYAFSGCSGLVSISVPQSVVKIGLGAFSDCASLKAFTIPKGVRSIEQNTFKNCSSLESIYIPEAVTSIQANNPFMGCSRNLLSIEVDENNPYYSDEGNCLIDKRRKSVMLGCESSVIPDYVTAVGNGAFYGCVGLTAITVPSSVTAIGYAAFENCAELKSIALSENVKAIEDRAFYQCSGLESILIPEGATAIGAFTFYDCTSLKDLILPDTISKIGRSAFENCVRLCSITFPESATVIEDSAFTNCFNIHTVTVSRKEHLEFLNSFVFGNCAKIVELYNLSEKHISVGQDGYGSILRDNIKVIHTSVNEKSSIERISDYLFLSLDHKYYLLGYVGHESELILPDDCNGNGYHIHANAFSYDDSITKVVLSDGVLTVGSRAFMDCYNLVSITLNKNLDSIEDQVFYNCNRLVEIYNLSSIEGFSGKVVHSSLSEESVISQDGEFLFITRDGENYLLGYVGDRSDILLPSSFRGDSYKIWSFAFYKNQQIEKVTIPSGVSAIRQGAFQYCKNLTSVVFESDSTISEIPYQAFQGCVSLESIDLPDSVVTIADAAFSGCEALVNIEISQNLTDIESSAFENCDGIIKRYKNFRYIGAGDNAYYVLLGADNGSASGYYDTAMTSCEVFYRTRIIAGDAFYGCKSLERVVLNDGLISIGSYAFSECESLGIISIPDTVTKIGTGAFNGCTRLNDIDIPNGVTCIDERAFYGCGGLTSITIPESVDFIGKDAFYGCGKLVEVYNLSGVKLNVEHGIDNDCVIHTSAEEESIIKQCGDYLFITKNGKSYLFGYCGNQTDIVLPSDYNGSGYEIYQDAFSCRNDITSVVISGGATSIGVCAFYKCANLVKVTIGESVNCIDYGAFAHAYRLTEVVFANPSNWYRDMIIKFDEKDLADTSIAASYLQGQHTYAVWQRK